MGKLVSRPKAPRAPVIVMPPAPAPAPVPAPAPDPVPAPETPAAEDDAQKQARVRQANLLQRSRGGFSTVLTSFRGLLSETGAQAPQRKTLLGE